MKYLGVIALLVSLSCCAADVVTAPTLAVDTTTTPPTVTITLTIDGTTAVAAMQAAVAQTTVANAAALKTNPNAVQADPQAAGNTAFVQALIPQLYKLVENTQRGASVTDTDLTAQAAAAKAKADADAAAAIALRPVIVVK